MPAEITKKVRLSVEIDGQDYGFDVGEITADVQDGAVTAADVREALAQLLTKAAEHLRAKPSDFALAAPSQG